MENLLTMARMATECVQAGRSDEALLHLGMLEVKLAQREQVGAVGTVPFLNGSVGYLNTALPLGTPLYADLAATQHANQSAVSPGN